jgi:hypothetical protein
MNRLKDKVAIVTGVEGGMGWANFFSTPFVKSVSKYIKFELHLSLH